VGELGIGHLKIEREEFERVQAREQAQHTRELEREQRTERAQTAERQATLQERQSSDTLRLELLRLQTADRQQEREAESR